LKCGLRFVVTHPSRKNKNAARVGFVVSHSFARNAKGWERMSMVLYLLTKAANIP
jgi:hypothetical protein